MSVLIVTPHFPNYLSQICAHVIIDMESEHATKYLARSLPLHPESIITT